MTGTFGPLSIPSGSVGFLTGAFLGFVGGILLCFLLPIIGYIVFYPITRYEQWHRGPQPHCLDGVCTTSDDFKYVKLEGNRLPNVLGVSDYALRCRCGHIHKEVGKRWVYIDENYVLHPHLRHISGGWEKDDEENFTLSTNWSKSPITQVLFDDRASCACLVIALAFLCAGSASFAVQWLQDEGVKDIDRWLLLGTAGLALPLTLIGLVCRIIEDRQIKRGQLITLQRLISGELDQRKLLEDRIAKLTKKRMQQIREEAILSSGSFLIPIAIGLLFTIMAAFISAFQNQGTQLERIYILVVVNGIGAFLLCIGLVKWRRAKKENRKNRFRILQELNKEIGEIAKSYSES